MMQSAGPPFDVGMVFKYSSTLKVTCGDVPMEAKSRATGSRAQRAQWRGENQRSV
jgi:hypothetical protein